METMNIKVESFIGNSPVYADVDVVRRIASNKILIKVFNGYKEMEKTSGDIWMETRFWSNLPSILERVEE